jgi:nitrite reductase/ring-hydroxylating ferredoxin subunit
MKNSDKPKLLPRFPNGWYALCLARDLQPGEIKTLQFAGEDIVLFRTRSGEVSALEAYCPHLGAHIGYGGRVEGEYVRCPFHGFEYNVRGECTSTPYGTRIPPKARARTFPAVERNGLIVAYFDGDGNPPAWDIPALNWEGWSSLITQDWAFRGHPQETTENSVDIGHFTEIHGYTGVGMLKELRAEGPYLTTRYKMTRAEGLFGRPVSTEFEIHVHGLGYSLVEVHVLGYEIFSRLFVLSTPTDGENIHLRIALSLLEDTHPGKIHPLLGLAPRGFLNKIIARETLKGFAHDVQQDFVIWQNKRYVQPPILAEGDGPVGKYRQWARQFYTAEERIQI